MREGERERGRKEGKEGYMSENFQLLLTFS